ncbi:Predicted PurR-regulated permease PerM [Rhodospirillales bacterium URHD0017]|nr:Predicted PurR-regulated permease PerM [Rhodospirillales bacterium URHD0017]
MAKLPGSALADRDSDLPVIRGAAIALLGAIAILALYFGRDVLIPTAVAVFFAFILSPALTWVRRLLPLPLAVAAVVTGGLLVGGIVAVLVFSQLADVAGSLTRYQANLHQKIQDVRALSEGGGAVSRFMSMVASLAHDLSPDAGPAAVPAVHVQSGLSNFASVAGFVAPLLYPLLSLGIIVILVIFILADRDHLSDQFVRLFGASDVHATSQALGDAATRVARVLALQLLTNFGFAVLVGLSLFALGMPNAVLWGLLAGALRFVPYVGALLGALLPTIIAFAVLPGWLMPLLVLGCIVALDVVIGQVVEPLLFGESTGVNPLALILSAIFWGTLWGPIGLLLSTPLTVCLLVMGKHVRHLRFLEILLGHEPALAPYQQIYRRLIRKAVAEASAVASAEIEAKGPEAGLDDAMGRMVVLAEADDTLDRLSPAELAAIVEGTDDVLDFLSAAPDDAGTAAAAAPSGLAERREDQPSFRCIGGRGGIDDAAAAIFAFALRRQGFEAVVSRRGEPDGEETQDSRRVLPLICYASHPSDAVRRYNSRKLPAEQALQARHAVIDYDVAPAPPAVAGVAGPHDLWVGDIASICRFAAHHALSVDGR